MPIANVTDIQGIRNNLYRKRAARPRGAEKKDWWVAEWQIWVRGEEGLDVFEQVTVRETESPSRIVFWIEVSEHHSLSRNRNGLLCRGLVRLLPNARIDEVFKPEFKCNQMPDACRP